MPFCTVTGAGDVAAGFTDIRIFYRNYGHGPRKVLLIIGLAGTHDSWGPQIKGLAGTDIPNDEKSTVDDEDSSNAGGIEVCAFDNRGMGRSSVPTKRSDYTTTIMAKDAIALMDHLGWTKAHVFGHSMGGMIACKLAALVPDRVLSLALLNVTGGGFQCLPKLDRLTLSVAVRFLMAKTPEERAAVDLDTHYSQDYLEERVGQSTRREILYQQYVKGISKTGMQSNHGFEGQINACWTHKMTWEEIEQIRSAGFLISVIHGRQDIVAQISHAKRLAHQLYPYARMVELHGGHLVSHERTDEVNEALFELIKASESKISPHDWTNLPAKTSSDWTGALNMMAITRSMATSSSLSSLYKALERLNRLLISLFGVFVVIYEYLRRLVGRLKPVRVGTPLTISHNPQISEVSTPLPFSPQILCRNEINRREPNIEVSSKQSQNSEFCASKFHLKRRSDHFGSTRQILCHGRML